MKKNKKILIIIGPGFEDSETIIPYYWLQVLGQVDVCTSNDLEVKSKHGLSMSELFLKPTVKIQDLKVTDYDAVIIPGGLEGPDRIRQNKLLVDFVKQMYDEGKLISSICHGPWVLIEAGIVKEKKVTCYIGMKTDLINAGAKYENKPVVRDFNIITADHPRNITPWMETTIEYLLKK